MATALIALSGDGSRLIGCWVDQTNGKLDEAFRGTASEYGRAQQIANSRPKELPWPEYCTQLADRTPVQIWWESREVSDDTTAESVLSEEVAKQFRR